MKIATHVIGLPVGGPRFRSPRLRPHMDYLALLGAAAVDAPAAAVGMKLAFFTSRWAMCPGQRAWMRRGVRLVSPVGSRTR